MSNIAGQTSIYNPNNSYGVFPKLFEYMSNNVCYSLWQACKVIGINYNVLMVMTKAIDRVELKKLLKPNPNKSNKTQYSMTYTHFEYSMVDRVQKILETGKFTYTQAIEQIGIGKSTFDKHISKELREKLVELGKNKLKSKLDIYRPIISVEDTLIDKSEEISYDFTPAKVQSKSTILDILPHCIYKHWSEPTIGRMINIQCRLFFHIQYVEKEVYFVAGYEYQTHPGIYQPDQFLHAYSLESISDVLQKLQDRLNNYLITIVREPELGEVKYTTDKEMESIRLNPASNSIHVEYNFRKLKAKTPVKLDNGEYKCEINSNQGVITDNENNKHCFVLDEKLPIPQKNIKCKVLMGSVTVFI